MHSNDSSNYGDNCAEFYDEIYGPPNALVLRTLNRLARGGSVLELGLATGRTALALLKMGLSVTGIESSGEMLKILRSKPGAEGIRIVEGDFASIRLNERFDLIFALLDTFSLLLTDQRQLHCLERVAEMLKPDGLLVTEGFRPSNAEGETRHTGIRSAHYQLQTRMGTRSYSVKMLYQEPEELDRLAAEAGLLLKERWCNWRGEAYRPEAGCHLSVYGRVLA